jgi:hypothetical protein
MNVALLNEYEIDIERLGIELEEQGYERNEVKKQLNDRYRRFSQKGDFRCVCCDERVEMVLSEEKVFFFRHYDKEKCSYSENHRTYKSQKENLEDAPKHRAGKAILRTYLEGICKTNNIRLSDGYRFRSTLSFVPDFILEFSNGQRWAIDYFTGLKNDRKYANSLNRRRQSYIQKQFTPIFLFDSYWLAYEPEINHVSLVDGEILCISQTKQDYLWTGFISELEPNLKNALLNNRPFNLQVKSMAYFAPHEREINITRFLQENENPKKTRTVYKPIRIPLEKALKINQEQSDFIYTTENESEYREEFKRQLELIYQQKETILKQQDLERARREEEEREQRELTKAREEALKERATQKTRDNYDSTPGVLFTGRSQQQMDSDLKRDMESLQRKNLSKKPYWYKQMVQHISKQHGVNDEVNNNAHSIDRDSIKEAMTSPASLEPHQFWETQDSVESRLSKWKVNEILNHYVNGEAYFTGDPRRWKEIVLNSLELIYYNKITIKQLLKKIKGQGIEFKQSERIMSYPIEEYIQFISKKVKRDIKI